MKEKNFSIILGSKLVAWFPGVSVDSAAATGTVSALELLNGTRQAHAPNPQNVGAAADGAHDLPPGFRGERQSAGDRNNNPTSGNARPAGSPVHVENAPRATPLDLDFVRANRNENLELGRDRNLDRENRELGRDRNLDRENREPGSSSNLDREIREPGRNHNLNRHPPLARDSGRAARGENREEGRDQNLDQNAQAPRRNPLDPRREDRREDSGARRTNQRPPPDARVSNSGAAGFAEILARLDPDAQRMLQRIFTGGATGERAIARSTASTANRSAENNSARYTSNGIPTGNNDAIHHVIGLLSALQRGNHGELAPPPDHVRPPATTATRARPPPPADEHDGDDADADPLAEIQE
ncbi:unnamed protein product [Closterium sp. NIES-54]